MPVREAVAQDLEALTEMVHEHAAHEDSASLCHFGGEAAREALFGPDPVLHALIAYQEDDPQMAAGAVLYYPTFSSWSGTSGIWIEDLYVRPPYRRSGLGRELLSCLRGRTTGRLEWDVREGNAEAWAFYESLGAVPVEGWSKFRWTLH